MKKFDRKELTKKYSSGIWVAIVTLMLMAIVACPVQGQDMEAVFNKAYWASQPTELRACVDASRAFELATKGFKVDAVVQVWCWSPYKVMSMRKDYGYTWVPSLLGRRVLLAPGLSVPGMDQYDPKNPPADAIKVSVDPNDYPPFDPPVVKPPVPEQVDPVLGAVIEGLPMFHVAPWYVGENGATITNARGTFQLVSVRNPFGSSRYWTRVK